MKTHLKRLMGALVVVAVGLAAFAPAAPMVPGATQPGAAGRAAIGGNASQLSTAGAAAGLSRAGQTAGEKPAVDGPVVILPDRQDVSPPLRDIEPVVESPAEPALLRFAEGELLPGHEKEGSFSGVDASYQTGHGPEAMPAPIQNWDGINNVGYTVRPPDTQGDVGPNHYMQWINVRFQIWNKSGASLYGPVLGNTLWSGFGGKCQTTNDGDPVTLYDHLADRWVMMQFALGNVGDGTADLLCFAVSQTPDPLGSWYRYAYTWPNTYFPDYPKIGLWPDGYYVSVNQFNDAGTAWRGAGVLAMERAQMLTGAAAQAVYFDGYAYNADYGGMLPADWEGSTPPPSGAPIPFAEWDDSAWIGPSDALRIWDFHVDWTTPSNSYFGTAGSPFTPTYTLNTTNVDPTLCAASPACINQPGTTVNLHDLADRLMHRLQYRNFGSHQTLVSNHTVDTNSPAGRAGIHWFELRNSGSAWAIHQQGVYGPADTTSTSRWMGSIAMDGSGNMALGYSITDNVGLYPSIRYAGRLAGDPLGTLPQSETTLVTGGGYQNDSYNRWGDYSAMQVDPTDDCTFWYTQEYALTNGAYNWYTRIGSFKFPSCGTPDFTLTAAPASQDICLGSNATVAVTVGSVGGFSSPVTLSAAFSPAGPGASFSPNPVTPAGSSTLTVSGAGAGATSVTVTGVSGSLNHQASATVNVATPLAAAPALTAPANGSTGAATTPTFTWNAVAGAASYDIQVASDPAFGTIVASATGLTGTSWTPGSALASDTVHYWRVRAVNACGSLWSTIWALRSAASACTTYASADVPKAIPDLGTVESTLSVPASYNLTDVNVTIGSIAHTWDADLDISLVHPDATVVELSTDNGGSGDNYTNTVFDDEAATLITAGSAPFTGSFRPEGSLATLDGKAANGTWRLRVTDDEALIAGTLNAWSVTVCGNVAATTGDYSDLAASYGAAWHTGSGAVRLGPTWTADTGFGPDTDIDDGVAFIGAFTAGQPATLRVSVQGTPSSGRWLRVWFDWDNNGVFDTAEKVYDGAAVSGNNDLVVNVPPGLTGAVKYRVRLYDSASAPAAPDAIDAASHGGASGGEVEDGASPSPLAVTLAGFSAAQQGDSVVVAWETVSELGNAGFNLVRATSPAGPGQPLNAALIPSQAPGSSGGFAYFWTDRTDLTPGATYYYWLEDVDLGGAATRHGPVSVDFAVPTAVTLRGVSASPAAGAGVALPWLLAAAGLAGAAGATLGVARFRWRG
jgi:subtilisin-like proprotein convertase family protein